jgi:hypothetical protein
MSFSKYYADEYIRDDEMCRTYGNCGEKGGAYRILVGKPESKEPNERCRCKWENNIKMDHKINGIKWCRLSSACRVMKFQATSIVAYLIG